MTNTIEQEMKVKTDKLVQAIVFQVSQGVNFDFACDMIQETTVFRGEQWEDVVSRAKEHFNPERLAKLIEKQFNRNFYNVQVLGEDWANSGIVYFSATSALFNDSMEIKMTPDGQLFGRMQLNDNQGVPFDCDFECEGVTDEYAHFGRLEREF